MNPIFFADNNGNGLIAVYNFQNNAVDKKRGNNGVLGTDITFSAGVNGNCGVYNGNADSRITVADNNLFSFTDGTNDKPFTFKLNFKQTTSGNQFLITKCDNSAIVGDEYRVDISGGKIRILIIDKLTAGVRIGKIINASISLNTFYNLIITYDGSKTDAGINIYLNGVLQAATASNNGTYTGMANGTLPLIFGNTSTNAVLDRFIGLIDEVYIYNKVISSNEITFLQSNYY